MNGFFDDALNALAMALVHFIWQGAVLGLVVWIALASTRNVKPQIRYLIACLGLLLCAL